MSPFSVLIDVHQGEEFYDFVRGGDGPGCCRRFGFVPVAACCFMIVLLHRLLGWLIAHSKAFGRFMISKEQLIQTFRHIEKNKIFACRFPWQNITER